MATGRFYVFDAATGERVCSFEDAPRELFGGLLDRATDPDGTIVSDEEMASFEQYPTLARRYEVKERLIDGEGLTAGYRSVIGGGGRMDASRWTGRPGVREVTLEDLFRGARDEQFRRIRRDNAERLKRQAETHSDRYVQALAELDAAEAMGRLRDRITSIGDPAVRREWMGRYPELFSGEAAGMMAASDRADERSQAELWKTVGGDGIDLSGPVAVDPDAD